jgi:hypothetical protein
LEIRTQRAICVERATSHLPIIYAHCPVSDIGLQLIFCSTIPSKEIHRPCVPELSTHEGCTQSRSHDRNRPRVDSRKATLLGVHYHVVFIPKYRRREGCRTKRSSIWAKCSSVWPNRKKPSQGGVLTSRTCSHYDFVSDQVGGQSGAWVSEGQRPIHLVRMYGVRKRNSPNSWKSPSGIGCSTTYHVYGSKSLISWVVFMAVYRLLRLVL